MLEPRDASDPLSAVAVRGWAAAVASSQGTRALVPINNPNTARGNTF